MAQADNLADIANAFLASAGNQTLAASGFQKLPSGLILQWGTTTVTGGAGTTGNQTVTFPTAFGTGALCIVIGGQGVATPAKVFIGAQTVNASTFSLRWSVGTAGDMSGGTTAPWLAIGI